MRSGSPFLRGFGWGFSLLACVLLAGQLLLQRVGELDLDRVVSAQLDGSADVRYLRGFNQRFFRYKEKLLNRMDPAVVAAGSSRAMQMRGEFFTVPFTNIGGSINSVGELEAVTRLIADRTLRRGPRHTLLFIDPWWFNRRFAGTGGIDILPPAPEIITLNMAVTGLYRLTRGNWIAASRHSSNLGIHALLTGDGFSKDGSFHYVALASGSASAADVRFERTFAAIDAGESQFRRTERVDSGLMLRACNAIARLRASTHLTLVVPPFAPSVSKRLAVKGYAYMSEVTEGIRSCAGDVRVFDFSELKGVSEANDCEFVDGFHGGDVVYARMLRQMSSADGTLASFVNTSFLDSFIERNPGRATAVTAERYLHGREADFLELGCRK